MSATGTDLTSNLALPPFAWHMELPLATTYL